MTKFVLLFLLFPFALFAQKFPKREFRGVWVASVLNIDFPSAKGLSSQVQQRHFKWILEEHQKNGMNAIIMQIRPAADAFYASPYEPWSEFLTGEQGKAPDPYYDPLTFMVEETHQKGMEFHAWLNPYRATMNGNISEKHVTRLHPEWFVNYGGKKIFNPALPEVRNYIVEVVVDILKRYDIDGIHFDDYFYPYPIANQDFPDESSYQKYGKGFADKAAWRRNNVDLLILDIHQAIQKHKKHVRFGISPFGVWRNKSQDEKGSLTNSSMNCYDDLHADILSWLKKGWIDYVIPQIYFEMDNQRVAYPNLVNWWTEQRFDAHLYIGQGIYKGDPNDKNTWKNTELPMQLRFNRKIPKVQGSAYFSSKSITRNYANFQDSLRNDLYRYPALVPASPWKDAIPPLPPQDLEAVNVESGVLLFWKTPSAAKDKELPAYYVIYRFEKDEKQDTSNPKNILAIHRKTGTIFLDKTAAQNKEYEYLITSVDRLHNESMPQKLVIERSQETTLSTNTQKMDWYDFMKTFWKIYWEYTDI